MCKILWSKYGYINLIHHYAIACFLKSTILPNTALVYRNEHTASDKSATERIPFGVLRVNSRVRLIKNAGLNVKSPKIMFANIMLADEKIQLFKTTLANATVFPYLPHNDMLNSTLTLRSVKFFVNFIKNVRKFCFLQPPPDLTLCWREHFMLGITVIFGF